MIKTDIDTWSMYALCCGKIIGILPELNSQEVEKIIFSFNRDHEYSINQHDDSGIHMST